MSNAVKLGIYLVLVTLAVWFGRQFFHSFNANSQAAANRMDDVPGENRAGSAPRPGQDSAGSNASKTAANSPEIPSTNAVAGESNRLDAVSASNAPAEVVSNSLIPVPSNTEGSTTNQASAATAEPVASAPASANTPLPHSSSNMIGYLGAFVGIMILLGLLVGHDVSHFFGARSVDFMFNDAGEGMRNPEYEEAESVWANGEHFEAIRLMRLYLAKNPREQYVALRIAEIYEKDLKNYLAAALEYEEVLKQKVEPERWGWAAIHLCNLYSKMGQTDKTVALLRRVESEYGQTAAAEKARKRLALFDSGGEQGLQPEEQPPPREF